MRHAWILVVAAAVAAAAAACGGDSPVAGKSWHDLDVINERMIDGAAFDADNRLILHGFFGTHTFRLDPRTDGWDDLGAFGPTVTAKLYSSSSGATYLTIIPFDNQPATLNRLDDRTWTQIALIDDRSGRQLVMGTNGDVWRITFDRTAMTTAVEKLESNVWMSTTTLTGIYTAGSDNLGNVILSGGVNEHNLSLLATDGVTLTPLLVCTSTQTPGCSGVTTLHTNRNGDMMLFLRNDISGSAIYQLARGSNEPKKYVGMPATDIPSPAAYTVEFDANDNMYLHFGSNSSGISRIYFLAAGSNDWEQGAELPRTGLFLKVDRNGRAYAVSSVATRSAVLK